MFILLDRTEGLLPTSRRLHSTEPRPPSHSVTLPSFHSWCQTALTCPKFAASHWFHLKSTYLYIPSNVDCHASKKLVPFLTRLEWHFAYSPFVWESSISLAPLVAHSWQELTHNLEPPSHDTQWPHEAPISCEQSRAVSFHLTKRITRQKKDYSAYTLAPTAQKQLSGSYQRWLYLDPRFLN